MNRKSQITYKMISHVPHRRGDEPEISKRRQLEKECSPQAWGWSLSVTLDMACSPQAWGRTLLHADRELPPQMFPLLNRKTRSLLYLERDPATYAKFKWMSPTE